ncbi:MAG TPA: DUF1549 domain-containing protein, partial [Gemmataceae bacterium]|nr:DUF1549 domain-containing protein [Gemmataceae bacterium]
ARVDALVEAKAKASGVAVAPPADDAEFLRRVYLDFAGTIPSVATTKAFLADTSPDKRTKLVEQLLNGPGYAPRMADLFHVALMERLGDNPEWTKYLRDSFAANKPFDAMAREMLRADPKGPSGAAFFVAKRLENYGQNPVDHSALTRDVGRLFLGKNFQCCECHDHLFVDDYKQRDFQGLHAFFKNTFLANAAKMHVAEKPTTEKTAFASVFTKVAMTTAPALPGMAMLDIPAFAKGMEFREPPDRKTNNPGVPKFSTLAAVSEKLPTPTNRDFARNIVNRLWFALMGRGLVHPLDLHHTRNSGLHPELLDLLATEFVGHKYDIKWLLGELARTKTYQRASLVPDGKTANDPAYFAVALEKRLSAEQLLAATLEATGEKPTDALKAKFLKTFANQPREPEDEVTPSLKAALFVSHDDAILGLLKPKPGNLADRLAERPDDAVADELYLSVLSRMPTADEVATVSRVVKKNPNARPDAVARLAWALLASVEFGVNH